MNLEIWKSLDKIVYNGFEIHGYEVSNLGRIRSVDRYITCKSGRIRFFKGVIRKTKLNNRGYCQISLFVNGVEKTCLVHRLVAIAFIVNEHNKPEVNHIDNNKTNNKLSNLEWITSKDNHLHAVRNGYRCQKGENSIRSALTNSDAEKIREMWSSCKYTQVELTRVFEVSNSSIGRIVRRESYV